MSVSKCSLSAMEQKFRILFCLLRSQEEEKVPRRRKNTGGHFRRAAGANLAVCVCVCFIVVTGWFSFLCWTANKRRRMFKWTNKQNESLDCDHVIICPPESQQEVDGWTPKTLLRVFGQRRRVEAEQSWGSPLIHWISEHSHLPSRGAELQLTSWSFISTFLLSSFVFFKNLLIFHHLSDWSFLSALLTLSHWRSCTTPDC